MKKVLAAIAVVVVMLAAATGIAYGTPPPDLGCQGHSQTGDCDHNDDGNEDNGCNGNGNPHCLTPTATPTVTSTPAPTETPQPTVTPTVTPTATATPTPEEPRDSCLDVNPRCDDVTPMPTVPPNIVVIDEGVIVTGEGVPVPLHYSYVYDGFILPTEEEIGTAVYNVDTVPTPPHAGGAGLLGSKDGIVAMLLAGMTVLLVAGARLITRGK